MGADNRIRKTMTREMIEQRLLEIAQHPKCNKLGMLSVRLDPSQAQDYVDIGFKRRADGMRISQFLRVHKEHIPILAKSGYKYYASGPRDEGMYKGLSLKEALGLARKKWITTVSIGRGT
jgi:hypothetical protein